MPAAPGTWMPRACGCLAVVVAAAHLSADHTSSHSVAIAPTLRRISTAVPHPLPTRGDPRQQPSQHTAPGAPSPANAMAGGWASAAQVACACGTAALFAGVAAVLGQKPTGKRDGGYAMMAMHSSDARGASAAEGVPSPGRRPALAALALLVQGPELLRSEAQARGKRAAEDYMVTPEFLWRGSPHPGVSFTEVKEGTGPPLTPGEKAQVTLHFDCKYKSIVAVSSRSAVTLAQNRTLEKPYNLEYGFLPSEYSAPEPTERVIGTGVRVDSDPIVDGLFIIKLDPNSPARESDLRLFDKVLAVNGKDVTALGKDAVRALLSGSEGPSVRVTVARLAEKEPLTTAVAVAEYERPLPKKPKRDLVERAGGMYSGEDLAPPPALLFLPDSLAGMKNGGIRRLVVPPELGYGPEGKNEIPPGKDFTVEVQILEIA